MSCVLFLMVSGPTWPLKTRSRATEPPKLGGRLLKVPGYKLGAGTLLSWGRRVSRFSDDQLTLARTQREPGLQASLPPPDLLKPEEGQGNGHIKCVSQKVPQVHFNMLQTQIMQQRNRRGQKRNE